MHVAKLTSVVLSPRLFILRTQKILCKACRGMCKWYVKPTLDCGWVCFEYCRITPESCCLFNWEAGLCLDC